MYNKNYAWTPQWDINLYFLFLRKKAPVIMDITARIVSLNFTKSWYSGAEKADLEREMIDPKLLMNMKKMLSGDWNAKYYQIF